MPTDQFGRALTRLLEGPAGTTATLQNYTDDGTTDAHGDPSRETDGSAVSDVPALFRRVERVRSDIVDNLAGLDSSVDVFIWLPNSYDVREPGEDDGSGGTYRYPTRLTDDRTGRDYDVVSKWDEGDQYRVAAKEV